MRTIRISTSLAGLAAIAAACAPVPTLDERLNYLIGRTEAGLVTEMGVPLRTYEAEGKRFLEYERNRDVPGPSPMVMGPWGFQPGYYGSGGYRTTRCSITFTLAAGRVQALSYRGDGC